MMSKVIDARNLACPQPVILAKKGMSEYEELQVIVNNEAAQSNIKALARKSGWNVLEEQKGNDTYLNLKSKKTTPEIEKIDEKQVRKPVVVLIQNDGIGKGPEELQKILMRSFFDTLCQISPLPDTIILLTNGIKLVCQGSEIIEELKNLKSLGVEILACGTCLKYMNLLEKLEVGEVSNMYVITEKLLNASNVVTP